MDRTDGLYFAFICNEELPFSTSSGEMPKIGWESHSHSRARERSSILLVSNYYLKQRLLNWQAIDTIYARPKISALASGARFGFYPIPYAVSARWTVNGALLYAYVDTLILVALIRLSESLVPAHTSAGSQIDNSLSLSNTTNCLWNVSHNKADADAAVSAGCTHGTSVRWCMRVFFAFAKRQLIASSDEH